jgi:hypothetical protein
VIDPLEGDGIETELVRVADHDVKPGVSSDEGDGDAWPAIHAQVLAARASPDARSVLFCCRTATESQDAGATGATAHSQ